MATERVSAVKVKDQVRLAARGFFRAVCYPWLLLPLVSAVALFFAVKANMASRARYVA